MADTREEHLTEELLDRLLHSAKIETYLDEEHITDLSLIHISEPTRPY